MNSNIQRAAKGKFASIEIGRGVAAAVVVLHHAGSIMGEPRFYGVEPFDGHFRNFNVGVDFFFVLSGFIIAWIHWRDIGEKGRIKGYVQKRFLRIYPPYWGVLAGLICLYLLVPSTGDPEKRDLLNIILSIFLIPNTLQPVLGVAWTLTHEIFFYVVFGAIMLIGRKALWIIPVWAVAIIGWNLVTSPDAVGGVDTYQAHFPLSFLFSVFNLEFIMGVAAAAYLRRRSVPFPAAFAVAGAALFLLLMWFARDIQSNGLTARLAFGLCAASFLLGMVEIERNGRLPLPAPLALLGSSSYAVYLIHTVVLIATIQVMRRLFGTAIPLEFALLVLFCTALTFGILYHWLVEPLTIKLFSPRPSKEKRNINSALEN